MGVDPPIDVSTEQYQTILTLLRQYLPKTSAWVYGSRAKWTSKPHSDLDLVVFAEPGQHHQVGELREAFEESNLPFRVDLFVWDDVPESFRDEIMANHVKLLARKSYTGTLRDTTYGRFSTDFRESRLGCLCVASEGVQTGPFGSQLHKRDYVSTGTPIVTVEHIADNRIVHDQNVPQVSARDRQQLSKYILRSGDIVFSRVGSVDRRALIRKTEEGWLFSGRCLRIRPDPNKIDPAYLSYFLGLPSFREHIRAIAVGATMPSLNTQLLSDVIVSYTPDIVEQRAVTYILGTLDDKIEMNRRMNETLETMARAVFKSWFVDFDPVRAKAEGHPTGLPPEIGDLFPDEFVSSEIGEIPKGWKIRPILDFGKVICGKTPPTKFPENFNGNYPFITIPDMRNRLVNILTERTISDIGAQALKGKLLPAGSVCVSCIASPGLVTLTTKESFTNQQINSILPLHDDFREYLLVAMTKIGDLIGTAGSGGSVFANLSTGRFKKLPILFPSGETISIYSKITKPLIQRIQLNFEEIKILSELRDVLLPKLISGELRIPDAEKFLNKANI